MKLGDMDWTQNGAEPHLCVDGAWAVSRQSLGRERSELDAGQSTLMSLFLSSSSAAGCVNQCWCWNIMTFPVCTWLFLTLKRNIQWCPSEGTREDDPLLYGPEKSALGFLYRKRQILSACLGSSSCLSSVYLILVLHEMWSYILQRSEDCYGIEEGPGHLLLWHIVLVTHPTSSCCHWNLSLCWVPESDWDHWLGASQGLGVTPSQKWLFLEIL